MAFTESALLLDEELGRLRTGRHAGEEAEERRVWSSDGMRLRLPGPKTLNGPSVGTALGLPALRTSRAESQGRTPFALIHRTVSKRLAGGSVARSDRVYFAFGPGQARAARLLAGAVENPDGRVSGGALRWQRSAKAWYAPRGSGAAALLAARYAVAPPPRHAPSPSSRPLGTASAHQRYIEREGALYSRGTIGEDRAERAAFWRAVERRERADGLVQCRIVAELPHEASAAGMRRIADRFLACFAARGLIAHAAIRRALPARDPSAGGDPRNVWMHLVYHDRPACREGPGHWRFAAKKDRGARGPAWLKELRARYAEACNAVLEREGSRRRYFPGRYAEMGIDKIPQRHLGPVLTAFERQGRATRQGAINLVCERQWERRLLLAEAGEALRGAAEALGAAAAPPPAGALAAPAHARLAARALAADLATAPIDARLVEAALDARDRDGRRERATRLARHAARARARRSAAADWLGIERMAEDFLRRYRPGATPLDARRVRRRVGEALAAGRQFEAAALLDRRAGLAAAASRHGPGAPPEALGAALDALDLEIAARPAALRLARRLGLAGEIARRAARRER